MARRFRRRTRPARTRVVRGVTAIAATLAVTLAQAPAAAAPDGPRSAVPPRAAHGPAGAPFDPAKLRATLDAAHDAGTYGLFSSVRDGRVRWEGASGVADVRTERPVTAGMRQRVGGITMTFLATAILQQVEKERIDLDAPVNRYLPGLIPGEPGEQTTVRMLLNHTSGIGDYIASAFPSLTELSPESLDARRFRRLPPEQLVKWGLKAPRTGIPGERWSYSNTNYVIAGLILEKVTGTRAEEYISRNVIAEAGLRDTYFPSSAWVFGPHPRMYESLYQRVDPPRDYSVYDMSWAWTAGALVSTPRDLNRFYRALLTGELIGDEALVQMKRAVAVEDEEGDFLLNYGLGLYAISLPCGTFWGHDGSVFGAAAQSLSTEDGSRQMSIALNLTRYQQLDAEGNPAPHPIDNALGAYIVEALCGGRAAPTSAGADRPVRPLPLRSAGARP